MKMVRGVRSKALFVSAILVMLVVGGMAAPVWALEGKAGEVIKTVEELKDLKAKGLLTEAQVKGFEELIKQFNYQIPIVKTTDRSLEATASKSYVKLTELNKEKANIGSKGELVNYGEKKLPFPSLKPNDPQAGVKAAWNWEGKHTGDDFINSGFRYYFVDAKGNTKLLSGDWMWVIFNFRSDLDPKPSLPGAGETWFKDIITFSEPFSSKGLSQLQVKYIDRSKDSDT